MPRIACKAFGLDNNSKTAKDNINKKKAETIFESARTSNVVKKDGEKFKGPIHTDSAGFLASVGGYNTQSYDLLMNVAKGKANLATSCITIGGSSVLVPDGDISCNLVAACQAPNYTYDLIEGSFLQNQNKTIIHNPACLPPVLSHDNNILYDASNALPIPNQPFSQLMNTDKMQNLKLHSKLLIKCIEATSSYGPISGSGFMFLIGDSKWGDIVAAVGSDASGVPVIPNAMTVTVNSSYSATQTQVLVEYTTSATTATASGITMNTLLGLLDSAGITTYDIEITQWGGLPFATGGYNLSSNTTLKWTGKNSATDYPLLLTDTSLESCFNGITIPSADFGNIGSWDVSAVTNMQSLFYEATAFNQDLNLWDTANVTTMLYMFAGATVFNQDLNLWDTANVATMQYMFAGAAAFNKDISAWNTANVTSMVGTFVTATVFNQDISAWNTANVTSMNAMFNSTAFNQDIGAWNISNVTNMVNMFNNSAMATTYNTNSSRTVAGWVDSENSGASGVPATVLSGIAGWPGGLYTFSYVFLDNTTFLLAGGTNYPGSITTYGNVSDWNVSRLTDMALGFKDNTTFNEDLSLWDTANVTSMAAMFKNALAFNQDISAWNTSSLTSMNAMFSPTNNFDQDLSWNTSNVNNMSDVFGSAVAFNGDITKWDTGLVTSMNYMFAEASIFNQDISAWNTANVTLMNGMFRSAIAFNRDISGWNTSNVGSMTAMFNNATAFNQDLGAWNISNVTNMVNMFTSSPMATTYNTNSSRTVAGWVDSENSGVSGVPATVLSGISGWPGGLYTFSYVFLDNTTFLLAGGTNYPGSITTYGNVSDWNVSRLTDMALGFKDNTTFNEDLSLWDTANVTNMLFMFDMATAFNQDISGWNNTSVSAANIANMFINATAFIGGGAGVGSTNSIALRNAWILLGGGTYAKFTDVELDAAYIYGP